MTGYRLRERTNERAAARAVALAAVAIVATVTAQPAAARPTAVSVAASAHCANVEVRNADGSLYTGARAIVAHGVRCSTARRVVDRLLRLDGADSPRPLGFRCSPRVDGDGGICRKGSRRIGYRYLRGG